jgi:ribosome-binding protein aMBF1 (putative translation factor)
MTKPKLCSKCGKEIDTTKMGKNLNALKMCKECSREAAAKTKRESNERQRAEAKGVYLSKAMQERRDREYEQHKKPEAEKAFHPNPVKQVTSLPEQMRNPSPVGARGGYRVTVL